MNKLLRTELSHEDQTRRAKRFKFVMARASGLEKKDTPWHLRWFYGVMRKMFGKDFYAGKNTDAFARTRLERHRNGSGARPEATCLVALHPAGKSPCRREGRLSFLN